MSTQHTPGPWSYLAGDGLAWRPSVQRATEGGFVVVGLSRDREEADAKLIAAAPDLLDELKNLRRAYVNLLESGRDRIVFLGGQCDAILTMVGNDPHLKSSEAVIAKATGAA